MGGRWSVHAKITLDRAIFNMKEEKKRQKEAV